MYGKNCERAPYLDAAVYRYSIIVNFLSCENVGGFVVCFVCR